MRNRFRSAARLWSVVVVVLAALTARNTSTSLHNRFTSAQVRSAPSAQSSFDGFVLTLQRACQQRSAPEVSHVASGCFFGRHVAPLPVVNQVARVQCASRSFAKVFVGQRIAPLPAPGKYRCPSSARGMRSSATLTVMASLSHLRSSKSCGAKYCAGSMAVALPNYYFKLITNGVPHWPSSAGPTAHFALAVQRAMPSSPAYFER